LGNIVLTSVGNFRVVRRAAFAIVLLLGLNSAAAQSGDDTVRSATNALRLQQYDQAYQNTLHDAASNRVSMTDPQGDRDHSCVNLGRRTAFEWRFHRSFVFAVQQCKTLTPVGKSTSGRHAAKSARKVLISSPRARHPSDYLHERSDLLEPYYVDFRSRSQARFVQTDGERDTVD
jgi:hypothetical protein